MKVYNKLQMAGLSLVASMILIGCSSSSDDTTSEPVAAYGSVLKGPIEGATVNVYDAEGNEVYTTSTSQGVFSLGDLGTLQSPYYVIKTRGGSYVDEATGVDVTVPADKGLESFYTQEEMQEIVSTRGYMALTPDTTIFTQLVLEKLQNEDNITKAMQESEETVYSTLIKDSSPLPALQGDRLIRRGNLAKAIPDDQTEAFAKNRAISFSYLMEDLNVSADKTFDIIEKIKEDIKDGVADGIDIDDDGVVDVNTSQKYALSRNRLFKETTDKLSRGELSEAQKAELEKMGFDTSKIEDIRAQEESLLAQVDAYLQSENLPNLHILPVMEDEDGNTTDAKATYSFEADSNVSVVIETPEGNWTTPMYRYNNNPLPLVVRAKRGDVMTLNLDNKLAADTTIHWHGFKIPADMDGGPDVPVAPDEQKVYSFTMDQPAAPLWFHPHPDMQTGKQVYMGLAGVFLLEDEISKELEAQNQIPSGEKDVVLLVQDRRFGQEVNGMRELEYKTNPMDSDGMYGDTILVNGSVMPKLEVSDTQYRFRLYNVSNARTYDFSFSDNRTFKVIATDGGLLGEPVEVDHIVLGAAERVEIVVDFSQNSVGEKVALVSKPFMGDMMGGMGGMSSSGMGMGDMSGMGNTFGKDMQAQGNMSGMDEERYYNMRDADMSNSQMQNTQMAQNGGGSVIMRFDVLRDENESVTLYSSLPTNAEITNRLNPQDAVNEQNPREFVMSMAMGGGMNFTINAKTFDMNRIDEYVGANTTEIWEIKNTSPMAHPFHAHAIQWQILERNSVPASGVDLGWKDTFLVEPGESVKIIGKFEEVNQGDYMYHCHILEHEDAGMMGYFRVGETGNVGN